MTDQEPKTSSHEPDAVELPLFIQASNQWEDELARVGAELQGTAEERADHMMVMLKAGSRLFSAAHSHHFASTTESLIGTSADRLAEQNLARAMHDENVPVEARDIYARLYPEIFALPIPPPDEGVQSGQV